MPALGWIRKRGKGRPWDHQRTFSKQGWASACHRLSLAQQRQRPSPVSRAKAHDYLASPSSTPAGSRHEAQEWMRSGLSWVTRHIPRFQHGPHRGPVTVGCGGCDTTNHPGWLKPCRVLGRVSFDLGETHGNICLARSSRPL